MIQGINHITISVKNIDSAFDFYSTVLKLKPIMKSSRSAYFCAGKTWIALDERKPFTPSKNYSHICFHVTKKNYHSLIEQIKQNSIQEWQQNKTEGDSLYLFDDSKNKLEIHYSTLKERIKHGKESFGRDVKWFV